MRRVPLAEVERGEWAPQRLLTTDPLTLDASLVQWLLNPELDRSMRFDAPSNVAPTLGTTSVEDLLSRVDQPPASRIAALVFHIGKCGSTLLQNILDAHPRIAAVGEPEIFMQIVCGGLDGTAYTESDRRLLFLAALNAYANTVRSPDEHLVVKFTSVCYAGWQEIRTWCPGVPALVVCREPKSLITAHLRSPVMWGGFRTLPRQPQGRRRLELDDLSLRLYGLAWDAVRALPHEEFIARTIAHYYQRILDLDDDLVVPVHYETMKDPERLRVVLRLCGVEQDGEEALAAMLDAGRYYTKDFSQRSLFSGDRPAPIAPDALERLVDRWVSPVYERLLERTSRLFERGPAPDEASKPTHAEVTT